MFLATGVKFVLSCSLLVLMSYMLYNSSTSEEIVSVQSAPDTLIRLSSKASKR